MRYAALFIISLWFSLAGFSHIAIAQNEQLESIGLSVLPAIVDLPLSLSASNTPDVFSVTITNISDEPLPIQIGIRPLQQLDPEVDPSLRAQFDANTWIAPKQTTALLTPGESRPIEFTVTQPSDPGVGSHHALAFFQVLTPQTDQTAPSSTVNPEVTSIILLTVPGDNTERAQFGAITDSSIASNPNYSVNFFIENIGTSHMAISPLVRYFNKAGSVIHTENVPAKLLLPNTRSLFTTSWTAPSWGVYSYEILLNYGSPVQNISSGKNQFTILPPIWILLIAGLSLLILLKIVVTYGLRRLRRSKKTYRPAYDSADIRSQQSLPRIRTLDSELKDRPPTKQ